MTTTPTPNENPGAPGSLAQLIDQQRPRRWWPHALAALTTTVGLLTAAVAAAPWVRHDPQVDAAAGAVTVALLAAAVTWRLRATARRPVVVETVAVIVLALGLVGTTVSTTVDGRLVFAGSTEARVHAFAEQLHEDVEEVRSYDALLELPETEAQARFQEFEPAAAELRELSASYSERSPSDLPDAVFETSVRELAAAAHWGAEAVEQRSQLLVQADAAREQELVNTREAYITHTLRAGAALTEAAELHGIDLPADRPVE